MAKIIFIDDDLKDLYLQDKVAKKNKYFKFQNDIVKRFKITVDSIRQIEKISEFYLFNSLHYEQLKGNRAGEASVRINRKYRLVFTQTVIGNEIITEITIIEMVDYHDRR